MVRVKVKVRTGTASTTTTTMAHSRPLLVQQQQVAKQVSLVSVVSCTDHIMSVRVCVVCVSVSVSVCIWVCMQQLHFCEHMQNEIDIA